MKIRYFSVEEVDQRFDSIMNMVEEGEHIYITRDGIPVAVMIPYSEFNEMQDAIDKLG